MQIQKTENQQTSFGMLKSSLSVKRYASPEIKGLLTQNSIGIARLSNDVHIQPIMQKVGRWGHDKFHVTGRELYVKLIKKADNVKEFFQPISKPYKVDENDVIGSITNSKAEFKEFIALKEAQKFDDEICG